MNPEPVLTLETLKRHTGVTDEQLDMEISEPDLPHLASCFDTTVGYVEALDLLPGEQTDVNREQHLHGTKGGMLCALKCWKRKTVSGRSFRALVIILLDMKAGEVAVQLCQYISTKEKIAVITNMAMKKPSTILSVPKPRSGRATPEHMTMVKSTGLLVREFTEQIEAVGLAFHTAHIIGPGTYDKTQWTKEMPKDRARSLVGALTDKVQTRAENFGKILQIIQDCGRWTEDIISTIRITFEEVNTNGDAEFPVLKEHLATVTKGITKESSEHRPVQFCSFNLPKDLTSRDENSEAPGSALRGQVATSKLWSHDVLLVYIYDYQNLRSSAVTEHTIIAWANIWHSKNKNIPKFEFTANRDSAHIRVQYGSQPKSESEVGTEAENITDKSKYTMLLNLTSGDINYTRHIVRHEFGHALGMLHEHQRSKFWDYASKFIDRNELEKDVGTSALSDYLFTGPQIGEGSYDYDMESIMHYWFKIDWIKNTTYHTISGIDNDPTLSPEEKAVLKGIHHRHCNLADEPSDEDIKFLGSCYEKNKRGERVLYRILRWVTAPFRSQGSGPGTPPAPGPDGMVADSERDGPQLSRDAVFKVGFVGTTSSGKSTTLNALLGAEYLEATSTKTTACTVCIKPNTNPFCHEEKLVDEANKEEVQGRKDILAMICKRNKDKKKNNDLPNKLVFSLDLDFLKDEKRVELYDIPGVAEKTDSPIYKEMLEKSKEMNMLIVEVSQDTHALPGMSDHISKILQEGTSSRQLFIVNKYDLFFENRQTLTDEIKQDICRTFSIDCKDIVFTSATFALESRLRKRNDYDDFDEMDPCAFYELRAKLNKLPETKEECGTIKSPSLENFKKLNSLMERVSRINDLEQCILDCCKAYFNNQSVPSQ